MRTLTKTGIRMLSAKYRSILIKCAIINASVFIGVFGTRPACADMWRDFKDAIDGASPGSTIKVSNDITSATLGESGNITISREVSIVGDSGGRYLSGNKTHSGFKIDTDGVLTLENITMQNFNNTNDGGAIYNAGTIESITGDFIGNTTDTAGGAIVNYGTIKDITGNFKYNSAKNSSGAIYNHQDKEINFVTKEGDITFDGNYVTSETGKGGAIYNYLGTVGLYADAGRSITFTGNTANIPDEDKDKATDVDGICNIGTLNINGYVPTGKITPVTYTGTVNLQNITKTISSSILGTTNIYGGTVNVKDTFIQKDLNLYAGTLNLGKGGTVTNLNANGGALSMSIPYGTFDNYENKISTLTVDKFTGTLNNFTVDFDANFGMDNISVGADSSGEIRLTAVNVLSNAQPSPNDVFYLTGEGKDNITTETGSIKTAIDGYTYTFTFDDAEKGKVLVTMEENKQKSLPAAIADATMTGYSAQLNPVIVYEDLGTLAGENRNFTIFGNGSTIDGNSHAGITVNNDQTFTLNDADMKNFTKTGANGGAIYNKGTINITGNFTSNKATGEAGGAIHNEEGKVYITDSNFSDNSVSRAGGAISTFNGSVDIVADNSKVIFQNNNTPFFGGAVLAMQNNEESAQKNVINIIAENNDIIFSGNKADKGGGGAIANIGKLNIKAKEGHTVEFLTSNDTIANANMKVDIDQHQIHENIHSVLTINDAKNGYTGDVILQDVVSVDLSLVEEYSTSTAGDMVIGGGRVFANGNIEQSNITVQKAILALSEKTVAASQTTPLASSVFTLNNSTLNLQNNSTGTVYLGGMRLVGSNNIMLDANLADEKMDKISATGISGTGAINISGIRLLSDAVQDTVSLDLFADDTTKGLLADKVTGNLNGLTYSPIYKYDALYDPTRGQVDFTRYNNGGYDDLNPAVMAGAVAAQVGGYLNQINSYENAFEHMDSYMMLSRNNRLGTSLAVKYITDAPRRAWLKPYAAFETVKLKHGPKVDNNMYGSFAGLDSAIVKLKHGWDIVYSGYASYDGSNQKYDGNSIYQNGGHLGATLSLYKGNFFTGLTANAGASSVKLSTMYGADDTTMFTTGAASKTGYDLELVQDWLIVQPSVLLSYSLVNMSDYTNASGVKISSDALHAIQIAPELKLISNLPHGWQPYVAGKTVWNMLDETKFSASGIDLPELSTKQYVQYGVGIQKNMFNGFYGYAQAMFRNGGRDGVALNAGLKMAF